MADLAFPMLTISALAPLFGAFAALRPSTPNPRRIATGISLLSALCSFEALREVLASGGVTLLEGWALPVLGASHTLFRADLLSTVTMSLFSAITVATRSLLRAGIADMHPSPDCYSCSQDRWRRSRRIA